MIEEVFSHSAFPKYLTKYRDTAVQDGNVVFISCTTVDEKPFRYSFRFSAAGDLIVAGVPFHE